MSRSAVSGGEANAEEPGRGENDEDLMMKNGTTIQTVQTKTCQHSRAETRLSTGSTG